MKSSTYLRIWRKEGKCITVAGENHLDHQALAQVVQASEKEERRNQRKQESLVQDQDKKKEDMNKTVKVKRNPSSNHRFIRNTFKIVLEELSKKMRMAI